MAKLTLSTDCRVVEKAKRYAARRGTSLSAMVTRYLDAVTREELTPKEQTDIPLGPVTKQASGLARIPPNLTDDEVLEVALLTKYGLAGRAR